MSLLRADGSRSTSDLALSISPLSTPLMMGRQYTRGHALRSDGTVSGDMIVPDWTVRDELACSTEADSTGSAGTCWQPGDYKLHLIKLNAMNLWKYLSFMPHKYCSRTITIAAIRFFIRKEQTTSPQY
jgi:hypothetical protein